MTFRTPPGGPIPDSGVLRTTPRRTGGTHPPLRGAPPEAVSSTSRRSLLLRFHAPVLRDSHPGTGISGCPEIPTPGGTPSRGTPWKHAKKVVFFDPQNRAILTLPPSLVGATPQI